MPGNKQDRDAHVHVEKSYKLSNNFQSAEFRVGITLPCDPSEVLATFKEAREIIEKQLERTIKDALSDTKSLTALSKKVIS